MSLAQQLLLRALIVKFWEKPYRQKLVRWGTVAARSLHAAAFRLVGFRQCRRRFAGRRSADRTRMVPAALRVSLPVLWQNSRFDVEIEVRQALEPWHVLGEEGVGRRHGPLCRFVPRARAGESYGADRRPVRRHLQWPNTAADRHWDHWRSRGRSTLSCLGPAFRPAPDDPDACAPDVRYRRYLERAVHRRMPLSCLASGWTKLRRISSQYVRSRGPPLVALRVPWAHGRANAAQAGGDQSRIPLHARSDGVNQRVHVTCRYRDFNLPVASIPCGGLRAGIIQNHSRNGGSRLHGPAAFVCGHGRMGGTAER